MKRNHMTLAATAVAALLLLLTLGASSASATNATVAKLEAANANRNFFVADMLCSSCSGTPRGDDDDGSEGHAVPDGGITLILLCGALGGLETLRRRFRV